MPVAIRGTGGGSVTLSSGAAAADTTLTLPNTTGTVALTASPTFTGTVTIPTLSVTSNETVGGTLSVTGASTLTGTVTATTITSPSATALTLQYGGTTGATLDTSGYLLVGTTSAGGNGISIQPRASGSNTTSLILWNRASTTNYGNCCSFNNGGSEIGTIAMTNTTVSYNNASDYRLKHTVARLGSGLATISALNPVSYKWVSDDSVGEGFIAHELQEVIPLAVSGEKDAVNEDGSIKPQGVDYSKIVVHLVAAIQELSAKNDALEARLAALEAK